MFGIVRVALRAFVVGVAVGVLVAPRPGAETRRMLGERLAAFVERLRELAAMPPIEPDRARTNGHPERATQRRRSPSEGPGARASS